jgi:hypothetical protein
MIKILPLTLLCLLFISTQQQLNSYLRENFCWKNITTKYTYARVKRIGNICPTGYEFVRDLCYPSCPVGYISQGYDCKKVCNTTNTTTCINGTITRSSFNAIYSTCLDKTDLQMYLDCYQSCRPG